MQWDKIIRPRPGVDWLNPAIVSTPEYASYMAALNNVRVSRTAIGADASQSHTVAWDHVNRIMGTGPYSSVPGHWQVLIETFDALKRKYDPDLAIPDKGNAVTSGNTNTGRAGGGGGEPTGKGGIPMYLILILVLAAILIGGKLIKFK
jgi:hypothetical protein